MAIRRSFFLVEHKINTFDKVGWIHCLPRTAEFLEIVELGKVLAQALASAKLSIKAFQRSYINKDGTIATTNVKEHGRTPGAPRIYGQKLIVLQTGKVIGKSLRTLAMRASTSLPNDVICDALGSIIPDNKIKRGADRVGATDISEWVTIEGNLFIIKPKADADGSTTGEGNAVVPTTKEAVAAVMEKQKGKP